MSIVEKSALWGATIMLVVSVLASILVPSPLNLLFAPAKYQSECCRGDPHIVFDERALDG